MQKQQKQPKELKDQFPNEAKLDAEKEEVQENNYFKEFDKQLLQKKYLQFTVYMEAVNDVLELSRESTVEQFAKRVHDLVMATQEI